MDLDPNAAVTVTHKKATYYATFLVALHALPARASTCVADIDAATQKTTLVATGAVTSAATSFAARDALEAPWL